tara:strand:- start:3959 stop:8329 length:4371 start_codon:yes stop_codon:yes gene_type:complete
MSRFKKIFATVTVVTMLGVAVVPVPASALTAAELQAQIDALMAQLNSLQGQLATVEGGDAGTVSVTGIPAGYTWSQNLTVGSTGDDVKYLQMFLNSDSATKLADSGAGSPGSETSYFGPITRSGVVKFQDKYAADVLTPLGLSGGTGFFGPSSRTKINALYVAAPAPAPAPSPTPGTPAPAPTPTPTPAPATGPSSVQAGAGNPAAGTLGASSAYNTVVEVQVNGGTDGASVTSVTVERFGLSIDTNVDGVLIADSNGNRHGSVVTLADNVVTIPFTEDPIVAPAGGSATFNVQVHVNSGATAGTIGFRVTGMNGDPSGLPVSGALHTLSSTTNILGAVTMDVVSQTTASVSVDIGRTDYVLTKFRLVETSGNEDVTVDRLTLFQNGTAADADLTNFDLVDPNGVVLATVAQATDKTVDFNLAGSPYTIAKGTTKDLTVRVDVLSGSNRTGQVIIQNDYDLQVNGVSTGLGILPTAAGTVDSAIPIGDITTGNAGFNLLTVSQGTLTVNKSGSSPSGTFGIGQANIVVGTWELQASGEDIQIQRADYELGGTSDDGDFSGTVKLMTDAGQTLHSQSAGADDLFDDDNASNDTGDQVTFSTYYIIPAGTILKVQLVADAATTISDAETVIGGLGRVYFKRMTSNTFGTASDANAHVTTNTLTASTATLTVVNNASVGAATVIEGQSDLLIGSFLFQTSASEGVNISSIVSDIAAGDVAVATGLTNFKIKRADTGAQIGSTIASPAATNNNVTVSGELNIPASTTVQIDLYANANTAASDGGTNDTYTASMNSADVTGVGATSGTSITGPAATVTARALTIVEGGTVTVAIDSTGAASSQFLTPGLTGVEMARIKLASTVEDMKVEKLVLRTVNGAGNISNVKLLGTGLSSDPSTALTAGSATFTFASGSEIIVPSYGSRVITAVADTTPVGTIVGGDLGVLGFDTADVIGAGSGLTTQESLSSGTAYTAGTDAYSGDDGDVIFFTVTADAGTNTTPGYYIVTTDDDAVNLATGDLDLNSEATDTSWAAGDIITKLAKANTDAGSINAMAMALTVGQLAYVHDVGTPANSGFKVIKTAVASGGDATGANTVDDITLVAADYITTFTNTNGLAGNTMRMEEVEPVISVTATGGAAAGAADQTVGTISIKASGSRDMTFDGIVIEKLGSSADWNVKDFKLYNGDNLISEVSGLAANTRTTVDAGAQTTTVEVGDTLGFLVNDSVLYIERDTDASAGVTTVSSVTDGDTIVLAADVIGTAETEDYLIVYSVSDADTSIASGTTYDVADASKYQVGDQLYVISATDTGDNGGATVASVGANSITVTQAALTGIADNAAAVANGESATIYNITRGSGTVVFDANTAVTALAEQTVTAGQTMTLTVTADTTYVKRAEDSSGNVTSVAATFGIRIPGSKGPLQVTTAQVEGFSWDYTPLNTGGAATYKTETDSYGSAASAATFSY